MVAILKKLFLSQANKLSWSKVGGEVAGLVIIVLKAHLVPSADIIYVEIIGVLAGIMSGIGIRDAIGAVIVASQSTQVSK